MTLDERWKQIEAAYDRALNCSPEERAKILAEYDAETRREVEQMFSSDGQGFSRLHGAIGNAALLVAQARMPTAEFNRTHAGKYRLELRLGEGGMGIVYRAFDEILQRTVALKFLTAEFAANPAQRQRLLFEARAASALNHPNIVTIHDLGSTEDVDFIVMEYVEGQTLEAMLAKGTLTLEMLIDVGMQAAAGLDAAHRAGLVHLDIKPANILIDRSGRVKLADFGIARRFTVRQDLTKTGLTVPGLLAGTVPYMSPEQARGAAIDGRSDIFSLGVVLYKAATGKLPFEAPDPLGTLAAILSDQPAAVRSLRPDFPAALEAVILKALAKDPGARFQTAAAFGEALRQPNLAPEVRAPHLPARVTRFIGRESELAAVHSLLAEEDVRLVNLIGPGGIGKTRLALEIAHQSVSAFESVWFVSLESLRDARAVPQAILRSLGLKEEDTRPAQVCIEEAFDQRPALLILDNFEHVVEAAPVVSSLLENCARLKVLVTSRALLRLRAEREFVVPPLATGGQDSSLEELLAQPGVALFLDRARGAAPALERARAIAEVCARLDGVPLAIELAAARSKVLSPKSILGRLRNRFDLLRGGARDLPERQQTLRHTIDWSFDLLSAEERILFQRLSVFSGGATLDAVEGVCGSDSDALDVLMSLADKSLLRQQEDTGGRNRTSMLETIRAYARERLVASGEAAAIHARHADYYLQLANSGAEQYDELEAEHNNFRAAMEWLIRESPEKALRMTTALWPFWEARGYWTEGREQLQRALQAAAKTGSPAERAKALYAAGVLADAQGDYTAARAAFEEHLALQRTAHDRGNLAPAINNLGIVALRQGDYAAARTAYGEALEILRSLDSQRAVAQCLNNLGHVALGEGDYAGARAQYQEALEISRRLRSSVDVAWTLGNLADVAREEGRLEEARRLYSQSFGLFREIDEQPGLASCMTDLGQLAVLRREFPLAGQLYQESLVIFGDRGDKRGIARVLEGFALMFAARGEAEAALRLAGATTAIRKSLGFRQSRAQRQRMENGLEAARNQDPGMAVRIAAEGERMTLEKAIEFALAAAAI